jgi:hypothetical protein
MDSKLWRGDTKKIADSSIRWRREDTDGRRVSQAITTITITETVTVTVPPLAVPQAPTPTLPDFLLTSTSYPHITSNYNTFVLLVLLMIFSLATAYLFSTLVRDLVGSLRRRWALWGKYQRGEVENVVVVGESAGWSEAGSLERASETGTRRVGGRMGKRMGLWWRLEDGGEGGRGVVVVRSGMDSGMENGGTGRSRASVGTDTGVVV